MSWGFRKRIKLFPGVHINVGKRGVSVSAGVRGANVTFGNDRITTSVGLPGSGLSSRQTHRYGGDAATAIADDDQPPATGTAYAIGRALGRIALFVLVIAAGLFVLWIS